MARRFGLAVAMRILRKMLSSKIKFIFSILRESTRLKIYWNQFFIFCTSVLQLLSVFTIPVFFSLVFNELNFNENGKLGLIVRYFNFHLVSPTLLGVIFILFMLFANSAFLYFSYRNFAVANEVLEEVSTKLFKFFIDQEISYHLKTNSAIIKSKVQTDCVKLVNHILIPFLNILPSVGNILLVLIALMFLNVLLTVLVIFLSLLSYLVFNRYLRKELRNRGKEHSRLAVKYHSLLSEGLSSLKETKVMKREDFVVMGYGKLMHELAENEVKSSFLQTVPKFLGEFLFFLLVILLGILVLNGILVGVSLNEIGIFAMASLKILPALNSLSANLNKINSGMGSLEHIKQDLVDMKRSQHNPATKLKNIPLGPIEFKNVSYQYENASQRALCEVSFVIAPGSKIAIIGASGSGKSTLIDLIMNFLSPTSGEIIYSNTHEVHRLSYVPQKIFLLDDTIKSNILYGRLKNVHEVNFQHSLEQSHCNEFLNKLAHKELTMAGEDGCNLSGGQRQRIGLARGLYNNPTLMVVDEGTSAMDPETEEIVLRNIICQNPEMTLIWVTHRYNHLSEFDHIYKLEEGKLSPWLIS
jgi:ABC-type multidrug transport system fused ATPase/permease subunit